MPAILSIFIKLIPMILQLIVQVEPLFKKGADKKQAVTDVVNSLVMGVESVATGGAAETLAQLKPLISTAIDVGAAMAFPKPSATSLVDAQR